MAGQEQARPWCREAKKSSFQFAATAAMPAEPHQKPCNLSTPYARTKPQHNVSKDAPATVAKPTVTKKYETLTLQDWLIVFSFVDNHPDMPQSEVVEQFKTQHEGALVFTQSTLSQHLKNRPALET